MHTRSKEGKGVVQLEPEIARLLQGKKGKKPNLLMEAILQTTPRDLEMSWTNINIPGRTPL